MSKNELIAKIETLNEWETLMEEAKTEAEAILDRSSAASDVYKRQLSNRFDSAAFKRVHDDLYKAFTKQVASRRFSISA